MRKMKQNIKLSILSVYLSIYLSLHTWLLLKCSGYQIVLPEFSAYLNQPNNQTTSLPIYQIDLLLYPWIIVEIQSSSILIIWIYCLPKEINQLTIQSIYLLIFQILGILRSLKKCNDYCISVS